MRPPPARRVRAAPPPQRRTAARARWRPARASATRAGRRGSAGPSGRGSRGRSSPQPGQGKGTRPMVEANRRPLPAFLAAFAFPDFRRLWTGAFLSSIGNWTQDVALAWIIHTRFGDPFYLGLRTFAVRRAAARLHAARRRGGRPHRPPAHPAHLADPADVVRPWSWACCTSPAGWASRRSCSSPSSPASRSRSRRRPTRRCSPAWCPPRPHPERGRPQLAAVQPLARDRAGDRGRCCSRAAERPPASR